MVTLATWCSIVLALSSDGVCVMTCQLMGSCMRLAYIFAGGAEEVRDFVMKAAYMVLGLGDVYLGAPCAVPVDPRYSSLGYPWT